MGGWVFCSAGLSPTLTAAAEGLKVLVKENGRYVVRRLTPREHFRLQGFPDTYIFKVSNAQLYKQAGNAVTVKIAKALASSFRVFLG